MPGMIEHLYFSSLVYRNLSSRLSTTPLRNGDIKLGGLFKKVINRERFMLAEIMPDLANDRYESHYKYNNQKLGLLVPDLYLVGMALSRTRADWSVRTGIYAHMYFDQKFLINFVVPRFEWDVKNRQITSKATGEVFSPEEFFSDKGLFGAYAETATRILDDELLEMSMVETLSDEMPEINRPELKPVWSWRPKFEYFAENCKEETGRIYQVSEAIDFIREQATTLTAELLYME